ncbi:ATP-dependent Clp protease [Cutibacterium acnes JCM 18918]|nr:ATP-dependent Clp protease [Cutibacterium acnes JCM 18918]
MDGVELTFTEGALGAIADKAVARGTGARGLRAIIEETLMDVMFDVPSRDDVSRVVVTQEAITGEGKCQYLSTPVFHGRGRLSA